MCLRLGRRFLVLGLLGLLREGVVVEGGGLSLWRVVVGGRMRLRWWCVFGIVIFVEECIWLLSLSVV